MRILATVALSFSAACFCAVLLPWDGWQLYAAAALLAAAVVVFLLRSLGCRTRLLLLTLSACAGLCWTWGYEQLVVAPVRQQVDQTTEFHATVTEYPQTTDWGGKVTVSLGPLVKAVYYGDASVLELEPGQELSGTAYWQDAAMIRDDTITTFTSQGVYVLLYGRDELQIQQGSAGSLRWLPLRAGRAMQEMTGRIWSDEATAAFVSAMLTGDRSGLTVADETAVSEVGLSHLFAVSGLHCAFLISLLGLLISPSRRRLFAAVGISVLLFYMVLAGMSPSIVRSCIMLVFALTAPLFRRDSDAITSMSAALLVILLCNPYACASISLQLSFAATAGILLWSGPLYRRLLVLPLNRLGAVGRFFCASVSASLGALVLTIPLTAYYFNIFTIISPVSNLLVVPAAGWAFMASFVIVLLGFVWLPAAQLLGWAVWALVHYALWISHGLMRLPGHALYLTNQYLKYWLGYVYAMLIACIATGARRRQYILTGVLAAMTLLGTIWLGADTYRQGEFHVLTLDVGQGAATLLYGPDQAVLVDCGSSNSYIDAGGVAADALGSMGVRELDGVVVTHYHEDHANGLEELLTRIPVETLYLPRLEDGGEDLQAILTLAETYDVAVCYVEQVMQAPLDDFQLQLYPPLGEGNLNEQGLAILASSGDFDVLITGDMASSTERALLERYTLPDIEVLLVGHHGSGGSTHRELLESLRPEAAVISVGDNSYGHPAEETLQRLALEDIDVYRTDRRGNILITVHEGAT